MSLYDTLVFCCSSKAEWSQGEVSSWGKEELSNVPLTHLMKDYFERTNTHYNKPTRFFTGSVPPLSQPNESNLCLRRYWFCIMVFSCITHMTTFSVLNLHNTLLTDLSALAQTPTWHCRLEEGIVHVPTDGGVEYIHKQGKSRGQESKCCIWPCERLYAVGLCCSIKISLAGILAGAAAVFAWTDNQPFQGTGKIESLFISIGLSQPPASHSRAELNRANVVGMRSLLREPRRFALIHFSCPWLLLFSQKDRVGFQGLGK